MAFEMICGQCRGNLLVEHFGVVVACPHCGAHLNIPAPASPTAASSAPTSSAAPPPSPPPQPTAPQPVAPPPAVSQPAPVPATSVVEPTAQPVPPAVANPTPQLTAPPPEPQPVEAPSTVPEWLSSEPETAPEPTPIPAAEVAPPDEAPPFFAEASAAAVVEEPQAASPELHRIEPAFEAASSEKIVESAPGSPPFVEAAPAEGGFSLEGLFGGESASTPGEASTESAPTVATELTSTPATEFAAPAPDVAAVTEAPLSDSLTDAMSEDGAVATDALPIDNPLESEVVAPASSASPPKSRDHVMVSKTLLLFLMSYASAMTLGFVWLLIQSRTLQQGGLESLPDLEPVPRSKGKVSFQLIHPDAEMPAGHDLEIGDSQRFGNIKVTVLKVTRGPVQFVHFSGQKDKVRFPTSPVLKLWLRIENVSENQDIPPLDSWLLFSRDGKDRFTWRGNQFVCKAADKSKKNALRVLAYDHATQGEWDLADLPLGKPLKPKEARVFYVPTSENDIDKLTGDLLWRVHIRKGFSRSGRGVTTVFEVRFHSDAIQKETA